MSDERSVLVDASVVITLARLDDLQALTNVRGQLIVPKPVEREITSDVAARALAARIDTNEITVGDAGLAQLRSAAAHLGRELAEDDIMGHKHSEVDGDIALLGLALQVVESDNGTDVRPIVVTDDKPLRNTCKALSIPVAGSIGILVRAVERGDLPPEEAKSSLEAMDDVGARMSASLYREARRLIEDAGK